MRPTAIPRQEPGEVLARAGIGAAMETGRYPRPATAVAQVPEGGAGSLRLFLPAAQAMALMRLSYGAQPQPFAGGVSDE